MKSAMSVATASKPRPEPIVISRGTIENFDAVPDTINTMRVPCKNSCKKIIGKI